MICLEKVLKISLQDVLKTYGQDEYIGLDQNVLKTSWRRFEDVLKTSWKRLEDVLKTYGQDEYIGLDQDVLKTSSEDVRLRRTYSSWSRRLEDVLKTSSEDEDERRLQDVFIKTNVCWEGVLKCDAISNIIILPATLKPVLCFSSSIFRYHLECFFL